MLCGLASYDKPWKENGSSNKARYCFGPTGNLKKKKKKVKIGMIE